MRNTWHRRRPYTGHAHAVILVVISSMLHSHMRKERHTAAISSGELPAMTPPPVACRCPIAPPAHLDRAKVISYRVISKKGQIALQDAMCNHMVRMRENYGR